MIAQDNRQYDTIIYFYELQCPLSYNRTKINFGEFDLRPSSNRLTQTDLCSPLVTHVDLFDRDQIKLSQLMLYESLFRNT